MKENELLPYYIKELTALRDLGKRFAESYPQLASHLQFEPGYGQNPQLAQLIEALAFLNARVSYQFEQDYPQLIHALIDIMYPHLTAPIPAMGIAQWFADKTLEKSFVVPRGTLLETDPGAGNSCRFSTCYEVAVHPIQVTQANLTTNFQECPPQSTHKARAVIRLHLNTIRANLPLASLEIPALDFYLQDQHGLAYHLYEALLLHCKEIAIVEQQADQTIVHWRTGSVLKGLGFAPEHAMLPQDARTLSGYRWLAEFFALPEKFLFVTLQDLPRLQPGCEQLQVYFYLDQKPAALLNQLSAEHFQLGCTPLVNLFPKTAEPLEVDHQHNEYRVISDLRRPQDYEIYQIQSVYSFAGQQAVERYQPLFMPDTQAAGAWQIRRVPCSQLADCAYPGTELLMKVINHKADFTPVSLVVETLCSNRHLPQLLLQQTPLPGLQPVQGNIPPLPIIWRSGLTRPRLALAHSQNHFLLLLHLMPNLLSYSQDQGRQLKQILQLYLQPHQQNLQNLIESISDLRSRRSAAFINQEGQYGYCQGTALEIHLQQRPSVKESPWLFFTLLEHFFSEQSPINSFIQLSVSTANEELYQWPVQAGGKPLL